MNRAEMVFDQRRTDLLRHEAYNDLQTIVNRNVNKVNQDVVMDFIINNKMELKRILSNLMG